MVEYRWCCYPGKQTGYQAIDPTQPGQSTINPTEPGLPAINPAKPGLQVFELGLQPVVQPGSAKLLQAAIFQPELPKLSTAQYCATQQALRWTTQVTQGT